jgi:NAD(P)-dependent dehydrogenase (short-subunit alcohol dehydrogenase family)
LKGKIALVTGAGRGAGQAVALALGRAGARAGTPLRVIVVDVNPDSAQRTADAIARAGGEAEAHVVDVANKMGVQTTIYAVLEAHGRVDILVNAAHVAPDNPALKLDEWEWDRTLDVNLKGVFLVSQTIARAMKETGGGLILNVVRPVGAASHAGVRAAREGLIGLTAALAPEWSAFGVRVETLEASGDLDEIAAEAVRRCERQWKRD